MAAAAAAAQAAAHPAGQTKTTSATATSSQQRMLTQYGLLYGSRTQDPVTQNWEYTPATITTAFRNIATESIKADRNRMFRDAIKLGAQHAADNLTCVWRSSVNFDSNIANDVFCQQYMSHAWSIDTLDTMTGGIDKELTMYNCLPADIDTPSWRSHTKTQQQTSDDDKFEPDIKKHDKKGRLLYIEGCMEKPEDFTATIANYLFIMSVTIDNPEKSELYIVLNDLFIFFRGHHGKTWLVHKVKKFPWIIHSLVTGLHDIHKLYVGTLSKNEALVQMCINKTVINACDTIDLVSKHAGDSAEYMKSAAHGSMTNIFSIPSDSYTKFPCGRTFTQPNPYFAITPPVQTQTEHNDNNKRHAADPNRDHTNKKGKRGDAAAKALNEANTAALTPAQQMDLKKQGYLICSDARAPKINHKFSNKGTPLYPCNGSIYKNRYCSRIACTKYHVPDDWNDLPKSDQNGIVKFVKATKNVSFASSAGPTTGE